MANKTELLARISDLSAQLGRELPTTGTNEALQAIIDSAEAELALLNEDEGVTLLPQPGDPTSGSLLTASSPDEDEADTGGAAQRFVKLRATLHVVHYVNQKPVCEIVPAGQSIYVDQEEAASLIAANHVYAL
ncbi:DNA-packaging protein FI [Enterobacter hormaechei]|uniref:DNA-packaging protein FI n=1 Tax=Enterobacter hormaechei TaxID=158836 RepID=UPI0029DB33D4|nr:DNA-packaging protein FI [Enterobacter hormaechei]MDX7122333.1 DNA-packaging protein FI [Enterobacter hormaechei]